MWDLGRKQVNMKEKLRDIDMYAFKEEFDNKNEKFEMRDVDFFKISSQTSLFFEVKKTQVKNRNE